jgi:hypothetical protein
MIYTGGFGMSVTPRASAIAFSARYLTIAAASRSRNLDSMRLDLSGSEIFEPFGILSQTYVLEPDKSKRIVAQPSRSRGR